MRRTLFGITAVAAALGIGVALDSSEPVEDVIAAGADASMPDDAVTSGPPAPSTTSPTPNSAVAASVGPTTIAIEATADLAPDTTQAVTPDTVLSDTTIDTTDTTGSAISDHAVATSEPTFTSTSLPQLGAAVLAEPVVAAALTPPTLTAGFMCVNGQGWVSQRAEVKSWDYSVDPFTFTDIGTFGRPINALAYNPVDGLLYAMDGLTEIWVMDANSNSESIGRPANGTDLMPAAVNGYNIGTFGPDGTYYVADTNRPDEFFAIDVTTGAWQQIPITIDGAPGVINSADFAYDPRTNKLVALRNGSPTVVSIDPATGVAELIDMSANATATVLPANGGATVDPSGVLYTLNNSGEMYTAAPPYETGVLSERVERGPTSESNDATGCTFGAKLTKTVSPETAFPGDTVTYTFVLDYQSTTGTTTAALTDTLVYGGTFVPGTLKVDGAATETPLGGTVTYNGSSISLDQMTLDPASTHTFDVDVVVPVDAAAGTVNNQADLTGLSPLVADTVSDFPATSAVDDETPLQILASEPMIGVSKQAGTPIDNGDGTFDVPFSLIVENTGNRPLTNLTLLDDVATQFGAPFVEIVGDPVVTSTAAAPPLPNTDYDPAGTGDMIDGSNATLEPGETYEVAVVVKITPSAASAPLENQATAGGEDPGGVAVTDLSDDGADPANGEDDPTPVKIPQIAVAKQAYPPAPAASATAGNYDVTYQFVVQNTGTVALDQIGLTDDWVAQMGAAFVGVVTAPSIVDTDATTTPTVGTGNPDLLSGTDGSLDPGQHVTVQVTVELDASEAASPLENQATTTGIDADGTEVDDLSDNGADPTTDNGEGGTDDPTPVSLPDISVAKQAYPPSPAASGTPGNFDVPFIFVVENTGNMTLTGLSLIDDFATHFGDAFVGVTVAPTVDAISAPNTAFDGSGDTEMLDGSGSFAPGATYTVMVTVEVDASEGPMPLLNQATAAGTDENGTTVDDLSDDGSDPSTDNGAGGTDDPTPVPLPDIAVAKSAGAPVPAASGVPGNYDVPFVFVVENTGNQVLTNLSLEDNIALQYGDAFVGVSVAPSVDTIAAPNADFDGSGDPELLDGTGEFKPGETFIVAATVEVDSTKASNPLLNQATATGTDPNGTTVNDDSDSGSDPETANPGAPGDTLGPDDPTPVTLPDPGVPAIGIAKEVTSVELNADDTAVVTFSLEVANIGEVDLVSLSVLDDVKTQFGPAFVSAGSAKSSDFEVNAGFDGAGTPELLAAGNTLDIGEKGTITFVVTIDPKADGAPSPLLNQAIATGTDPVYPDTPVTDKSDSGSNPNSSNPGEPGDNGTSDDPTPVAVGTFDVSKKLLGATRDGAGKTLVSFEVEVTNTSSSTLTDVKAFDDVLAQFASVNIDKASLKATDGTGTANAAWDGTADSNLFAEGQSIAPADSLTVTLSFKVDPAAKTDLTNVVTATATGPNGKPLPTKQADAPVTLSPPVTLPPTSVTPSRPIPKTGVQIMMALGSALGLCAIGFLLVGAARKRRRRQPLAARAPRGWY